MLAQPKHTVIIVTCESTARVDLLIGKETQVTGVWSAPRTEGAQLSTAITNTFELGDHRAAQTWVLVEDLWSGRVTLAADVVKSLTHDQLGQALALEAEYDSGMSPFDSRLSFVASNEPKTDVLSWWVTQAEASQVETIQSAFPKWAGKLTGLGTPTLSLAQQLMCDLADHRPLHVRGDAQLGQFALDWVSSALAKPTTIPAIRLSKAAFEERHRWQLSWTIAACLLFASIVHWSFINQKNCSSSLELSRLKVREKELKADVDSMEQRIRDQNGQAKKLQLDQDNDKRQRTLLIQKTAAHNSARQLPAAILEALSITAMPEHAVSNLQLEADRVTISGIAVNGQAVAKLAQRIDEQMRSLSWSVLPPMLSVSEKRTLVEFQLTLVPTRRSINQLSAHVQGGKHDS